MTEKITSVIDDTNLIKQRAEKIKKLDNDVKQLAEIFVDLNQTIQPHDEILQTIDHHVNLTNTNVNIAHQEMVIAEQYQNNYQYYLTFGGSLIATAIGGPYLLGFRATCVLIPSIVAVAKGYEYFKK